jgi:hypothetical protein
LQKDIHELALKMIEKADGNKEDKEDKSNRTYWPYSPPGFDYSAALRFALCP